MYLGIDFSGGAAPWQARCARPTVWIASISDEASPRLIDLHPVQELPGPEEPFARLVTRLRRGDFIAAGIDAPFSIPAEHLAPGGHRALLARVAALPDAADRPFPPGDALVAMAEEVAPLRRKKPMRATEKVWSERGVNTRSTLWNGPRAGAPFTAACLALLARAGRPVWSWEHGPGMLVESFPAAQLRTWGLPHSGYGKPEQRDARDTILVGLAERLDFTAAQRATMLDTPDALDAVVAAFAGVAAVRQGVPERIPADGLIAVAEDRVPQDGAPAAAPGRKLPGRPMKLYLAGPDVFHPDAVALGARKKALCASHGLVGLYPLDGGTPDTTSAAIHAACLAMMREADGGVFNLTPFRGPSADVGTVFELGFMAAMGKPVFAYSNDARDLLDRLHVAPGLAQHGDGWRDPDGMAAEDFGLADNLMLDETLALQGRRIYRRDVAPAGRFNDLAGFEACVIEASAAFAARTA